jgi:hypothetical protein
MKKALNRCWLLWERSECRGATLLWTVARKWQDEALGRRHERVPLVLSMLELNEK